MSHALTAQPPQPVETQEGVTLVKPSTGEAISLVNGSLDELAGFLDDVRTWEATARYVKQLVSHELSRRAAFDATKTLRAKDWKIEVTGGGTTTEYDGERLYEALEELVHAGAIGVAAMDKAVETQTVYKVKAQGVKALLSLGGRVAEEVAACGTEKPQEPRTKLSRVS